MRDRLELEYQRKNITTERVEQARKEFIQALEESVKTSGLYRNEAQGKIAHLLANLYDEVEKIPAGLPNERERFRVDRGEKPMSRASAGYDRLPGIVDSTL